MQSLLQARRFAATLVTILMGSSLALAASAAADSREQAERLAAQAEKILNSWSGRPETIMQAEKLIQEALALDPNSGHLMVEQGRAILMTGSSDSGYSPKAATAALELFHRAAKLDPPYGRAFVLLGHVYTEVRVLPGAKKMLARADELVPNDPWLKLNWGAYYAAIGEEGKQFEYAEQAIATGTTNVKALVSAYEILLAGALKAGDRAKADAAYAKAAEIQTRNAWVRGNYARNVIMHFADFDTGEKLAREALALMDYGHARQTLSLALYGRWARSARDGRPLGEQEALFDVANSNDPGGRYLPECAMGSRTVGFVFDAVARKGVERRSMQRC